MSGAGGGFDDQGFGRAGGSTFNGGFLETCRDKFAVQVDQAVRVKLGDFRANGGARSVTSALAAVRRDTMQCLFGIFRVVHFCLLTVERSTKLLQRLCTENKKVSLFSELKTASPKGQGGVVQKSIVLSFWPSSRMAWPTISTPASSYWPRNTTAETV